MSRNSLCKVLALLGCLGSVSCMQDAPRLDSAPELVPTVPVSPQPRPQGLPPPISGGTLLILRDGHTAVAADPDRDRVWIVDLESQTVRAQIRLAPNDEPGRLIEDGAGRVHVVLRSGQALATIDPSASKLTDRRAVCGAPRGVAYDPQSDAVHVACATGELVTLPAGGGAPLRSLRIDSDLRDVIVSQGALYVSRFRAAELLKLGPGGEILARVTPSAQPELKPAVAWRTLVTPSGSIAMLHQRAKRSAISTQPGGYGRPGRDAQGAVHSAVSVLDPAVAAPATGALAGVALAVDLAVSADGTRVALAAAGSSPSTSAIFVTSMSEFTEAKPSITTFDPNLSLRASVIAVAFDGQGRLIAQTREPAALYLSTQTKPIPLPGDSVADEGHTLFHRATSAGLACASCHPEAGEDGNVWNFDALGPRRTQALRGGLLSTRSFHWDGEFDSFSSLLNQVFTLRMSGPSLTSEQAEAMAKWIDAQPAPVAAPARDAAAAARGRALFNDAEVGCSTCHSGPKLTNNQTVEVGTGAAFQVPWLIGLAARAPYLHNGCAASLSERFEAACGGGDRHGKTSQLTAAQLIDLVTYLETL